MSALVLDKPVAALAAEVLEETAALIERVGFTQLQYEKNGVHCTQGAVNLVALKRIPEWSQCAPVLELAITTASKHVGQVLVLWNDMPGRTRAEVVHALWGSARELRAA